MTRKFILLTALLLSVSASADEKKPLLIVGAGNGAQKLFGDRKTEAENFAGLKIEYGRYRAAAAVANLSKGSVDAYTGPRVDSFFPLIEKEFNLPPQKIEDFRSVPTRTAELFIFFNSKNKIEKLSEEQIRGIFAGEITNWKSINGTDQPLEAYIGRDKTFIMMAFQEKFLKGAAHKINETKDDEGLMRILKAKPNAVAFTSDLSEPVEGISQLPAHVSFNHFITIRKNARPEAHKLLDWVEKNVKVKKD